MQATLNPRSSSTERFSHLMDCYSQNYVGLTELLHHTNLSAQKSLHCESYQLQFCTVEKTTYTELMHIKFGINQNEQFSTLVQFRTRLYHDTCQAEVLPNPICKESSVIRRIIGKVAPQWSHNVRSQYSEKYYTNYMLHRIIKHFDEHQELQY